MQNAVRHFQAHRHFLVLIGFLLTSFSIAIGEREQEILITCGGTSGGDARQFAACVATEIAGDELNDLLTGEGFGCNNEIRKLFSPWDEGCEAPPEPPRLLFLMAHREGYIAGYEGNSLYYSPDGNNLRGGGLTERVYGPGQAVLAIIPYDDGVMTAFEQGGIYFSPDGRDLGGGGNTTRRYDGSQTVVSMVGRDGGVETCFSGGGCYFSPNGDNLGGGGSTERVN